MPKRLGLTNRYEILDKLGEGGAGEIYVAEDPVLGRRVAVKRLRPAMLQRASVTARFYTEAQVTAQLDHPHIVPIHAVQVDEDGPRAYAMKLVRGRTLGEIIDACRERYAQGRELEPELSLEARLEHLIRVCEAIHYAHDKGVIHRDLKPSNIMIGPFGEVYVMDWGIARVIGAPADEEALVEAEEATGHDERVTHTKLGEVVGTPAYLSPEQAAGDNETLDGRSDQYALGLILQELVTLERAVAGGRVVDLILQAMQAIREPVRHVHPQERIAPELEAIIAKATAELPRDRYPHVGALADDLRRYLHGDAVAARPDRGVQRVLRWIAKNRAKAATIMALLLVLSAGVVVWRAVTARAALAAAAEREHVLGALLTRVAAQRSRIDAEFVRYEGLVRALAVAAEARLEGPPQDEPLYHEDLFDDEARRPADVVASEPHGAPVSPGWLSVVTAPGVPLDAVRDQARRLAPLRHTFRDLFVTRDGTVSGRPAELLTSGAVAMTWGYVALESGVMVNYPGVGGFPDAYDPRGRPWYVAGKAGAGARWGEPYPDILGGKLLLSSVRALHDAAGRFVGVAGADMTLKYLVEDLLPLSDEPAVLETVLLDDRGMVVARSSDAPVGRLVGEGVARRVELQPFALDGVVAAVKAARSGWLETATPEGARVAVYQRLPSVPYTYVALVDATRLFGQGR